MKNVIIRINDISEIDTSKISVYDLNNRYVDAHGIMYGLKYSKTSRKIEIIKIVTKDNKTESNQLEDIFRNLEIDGMQGVDNLTNYQKELINYPRSLTYYQAKMDDRGRDIIDTLASSNRKVMRFIYLAEMLDNIRRLYKSIDKMIGRLNAFLDK